MLILREAEAGAMGVGSECASWEPEAEAPLITKMLWVVSCPPPKSQGSRG